MNKRVLVILLFSFIIFLITFALRYSPPLELYPQNDTYFEYTAYSNLQDITKKASTSVDSTVLDTSRQHLHYTYRIGRNQSNPTLLFHSHELVRTIDIQSYRKLELTVEPEKTDDFSLTLYMYIPGFSDPGRTDTHRPYTMKYRIDSSRETYTYPLRDFATPTWWFDYANTSIDSIPETDWKKMTHIMFNKYEQSHPEDSLLHQISIKRIRLVDSLRAELLFSVGTALIFGAISAVTALLLHRKKESPPVRKPTYRKVSAGYSQEDADRLIAFLGHEYGNPLMSLDLIRKKLALNSYQVNEILRDRFSLQYKQYINHIRISEAKRLLTETNRQISDIAEQVGYCYSNSFARIFRKIEGMTPNQYRQKNRTP
ncbi:MAG: helix-turn-helix domain-containing protein [Fibrobacterota bacterium]